MRELQDSTPLRPAVYVLAKYTGTLVACLIPLMAWALAIAVVMTAIGHVTPAILYAVPVAFLAITVPAFAFVAAFSIVCPLFLPIPVYQVLFTGYWFWANFIPPGLFPTLNGTPFTPSGIIALQAFFDGHVSEAMTGRPGFDAGDAVLNVMVLALCAAGILFLAVVNLRRRARLA